MPNSEAPRAYNSQEKGSGEVTRQRILEASVVRFARASYEEVKLRDIASDVGVDVAHVHRSFGSKEQLFTEAFKLAARHERLMTAEEPDLIAVIMEIIFNQDTERTSWRNPAVQIFVHSLTSPQAREVLHLFLLNDFIEPLAAKLAHPAPQRAALIGACLAGICILRDILLADPLLDASRNESQPLIEEVFQACLGKTGRQPQ